MKNWTLQELANLDTKTTKFLTMYKMHHPKSDVNRLFLARTGGDRGLIQLELFYKTTIITSRRYKILSSTLSKTMTTGYPCTPSADSQWRQSTKSGIGSACNTTCRGWRKYYLCPQNKGQTPGSPTAQVQVGIKSVHGKYLQWVKQADVDQDKTSRWLKEADLKEETKG